MNAIMAAPARGPTCSRVISAIELRAMAHRGGEAREVVDGADQDHAERDPQQAGQPAEGLGGEDRPRDRSGRRDGREVLREQIERPRRHEVDLVVDLDRGSGRAVVELELLRDPAAVDEVGGGEEREEDQREQGEGHRCVILALPPG